MENYENDQLHPEQEPVNEFRPEPVEQLQEESVVSEPAPEFAPRANPVSQPYSGAGVGRKESPFADSPYVMNHRTEPVAPQRPNPSDYRCGSTYVPPIPPQYPPVKPKKETKAERMWGV